MFKKATASSTSEEADVLSLSDVLVLIKSRTLHEVKQQQTATISAKTPAKNLIFAILLPINIPSFSLYILVS